MPLCLCKPRSGWPFPLIYIVIPFSEWSFVQGWNMPANRRIKESSACISLRNAKKTVEVPHCLKYLVVYKRRCINQSAGLHPPAATFFNFYSNSDFQFFYIHLSLTSN